VNIRILSRVVVYDKDAGRILLVRNKGCDFWYIPGGGWEYEKENILNCGIREVKEETGLDIVLDKFMYLREYHENQNKIFFETFWLAHVMKSFNLKENHIDLDPNGSVEESKWFTKKDIETLTVFPEFLKEKFWLEVNDIYINNNRFVGF
jgi:8-oxo-dGTP pyrophosphatase MutT (NUDIX family)